jgi:hypothetical protein
MVAIASKGVGTRLEQAVDALVDESIDAFSTQALGEDLRDIRRSVDRCIAFIRSAAPRSMAGARPSRGCAAAG